MKRKKKIHDTLKKSKIHTLNSSLQNREQNGAKAIFEKTLTENSVKQIEDIKLHIKKALLTSSRINIKMSHLSTS